MKSFEIINDITKWGGFDIQTKIDFSKHLSQVICYNKEFQNLIVKEEFLNKFFDLMITNEDKKYELPITRLFYLIFNNTVIDNHFTQEKLFNEFFLIKWDSFSNQNILKGIDRKTKKFILSLYYNIIVMSKDNLRKVNKNIIKNLLTLIDNNKDSIVDNDSKEINDWIYLLMKFILKSNETCFEASTNLLNFLLNDIKINQEFFEIDRNTLILLELLRDFLELHKDNGEIEICENNILLLSKICILNIKNIDIIIKNFKYEEYKKYDIGDNNNTSINFKLFLCFSDVFSVIFCENSLHKILIPLFEFNFIFGNFYEFLIRTDKFYDEKFLRNKLNREYLDQLPENNIFHGFQTNILKFLSNFFHMNKESKKYFLEEENNLKFYYLLNHMKLDKCNPFKKEWTVLVLKVLCQDCPQIQEKITQLKVNDIDPFLKDYLLKNNYNFKIDTELNKLYVNKNEEI